MQDLNYTVAKNLKIAMVERDIDQKQLAEALNVTRQTIGRWCDGSTLINMRHLEMLSEILKCTPEYLMRRGENK